MEQMRSGGRFKLIKDRFKQLQKGPLRSLVAAVGTLQQSVKHRSAVSIYVDRDGDWHNRRRELTLVSPELNVDSMDRVRAAAMDLWCYDCELRHGDTVIDIGAGIGDDAVVFSKLVGERGQVVAIEAHPQTYRCLLKTIAANRLGNVIAINAAISDTDGYLAISDGPNFLSNSTQAGAGAIKVRSRKLDELVSELGLRAPDLVKMNIEGAETAALRGMMNLLGTTPHVIVSCHDFKSDRGDGAEFRTFEDVKTILRESGFQLRGRGEDPRPELRYYVYGSKNAA